MSKADKQPCEHTAAQLARIEATLEAMSQKQDRIYEAVFGNNGPGLRLQVDRNTHRWKWLAAIAAGAWAAIIVLAGVAIAAWRNGVR